MATIVFDIHTDRHQQPSNDKNLSVLIGTNRFFFYISDGQQRILSQKHYVLEDVQPYAEIQSIIQKERILSKDFNSVNIAIDSTHFVFVPKVIYRPSIQKTYLQGIASLAASEMIFSDEIEELDVKNIHTIDNRMYEILERNFTSFKMFHSATPLLRRTKRLVNGNDIIVNVQPNTLNIIVYKNNKFQLYNTYKYNSAEAFLYYVLLMYQQFDLDINETPLTLMGGIMPDSMIYKLLTTYVRQIKFAKRTKYYQFSPEYSNVPQQFHFDLYSLSVCE